MLDSSGLVPVQTIPVTELTKRTTSPRVNLVCVRERADVVASNGYVDDATRKTRHDGRQLLDDDRVDRPLASADSWVKGQSRECACREGGGANVCG